MRLNLILKVLHHQPVTTLLICNLCATKHMHKYSGTPLNEDQCQTSSDTGIFGTQGKFI